MKSRELWIALALVPLVAIGYTMAKRGSGDEIAFRFVQVERGTVEEVVTSTGTVQPTETVEVGTQVSGLLSRIYVDFNDGVHAGDLLAEIDPTILQQEVRSAEASLERSQAELGQAQRTLDRTTELFEAKVVTASEVETAQYQFDVTESSFQQAQISLERAKRNLEYTKIRAPVDGVVIERSVDEGQTVAASMSAPVLFLIAGDLSEMEILASVDESEVGLIRPGQEVEFSVQAYAERTFFGKVSQVRLQSSVVENVVTYGVVIDVDNSDGALLPGMTATVSFIVQRAENVLKVANSALRFQPTQAMRNQLVSGEGATAGGREFTGGQEPGAPEGLSFAGIPEEGESSQKADALLYHLDAQGNLAVTPVQTGITDRQSTVIIGPEIFEGMQVIAAVATGTVTTGTATTTTNPFQSQSGSRRPGPPMM